MANPIPFPLPDRPDQFQLDRQWLENYLPGLKYGARIDGTQIVGGNITIEDTGIPVGIFDTLDFVGATIVDNGDGSVTITVTADVSSVDWSTTNWTNFFTDIDWSLNTDWDSFVTSLVTNWSATNWDNFIDTFITNVDSDDVFNFLNQMAGTAKGDILAYNGSSWVNLGVGADGLFLQANSVAAEGVAWAAGGGGAPLTIQEEGVNVETATTQINFIGAGATATTAGVGLVDVTIPGYTLEVEDEGGSVDADVVNIDFVGPGVTATQTSPGNVEVTIPGTSVFTLVPQQIYGSYEPDATNDEFGLGSKGDMTSIYVVEKSSGNDSVKKITKDAITGLYRPDVAPVGAFPVRPVVAFDSTNVYVSYSISGNNPAVERYALDLTGATSMTLVGGPGGTDYNGALINGTQLYLLRENLTDIDIYDISGTNLNFNSTITLSGGDEPNLVGETMNLIGSEIWIQSDADQGMVQKYNSTTGAFITETQYYERYHRITGASNSEISGFGYSAGSTVFETFYPMLSSDLAGNLGAGALEVITYSV